MQLFKEIDSLIREKILLALLECVPSYRNKMDSIQIEFNKDSVYLSLNEFSEKLAEELQSETSSVFVLESFDFINMLGESNNLEIINIVKVGILEILYTGNCNRSLVRNLLSEKLKPHYDLWSKYYN